MNRDLIDVLRSLNACDNALDWSEPYGSDWEKALDECDNRSWLLWLAGRLCNLGRLPQTAIVLCACAYARTALKYVPEGEERPLKAVEAAEKWTRGEATDEDVREARDAAYAAAAAAYAAADRAAAYAADAAYAAANAAYAADAADAAYAAANAAYAADAAAAAATYAAPLTLTKQHLGAALIEGLTKYAQPT